jgi:hypothetical protein
LKIYHFVDRHAIIFIMKTASVPLVLSFLVGCTFGTPIAHKNLFLRANASCDSVSSLSIPQGFLAKNSVPAGWLPDSAAGTKMSEINGKTGKKAAL